MSVPVLFDRPTVCEGALGVPCSQDPHTDSRHVDLIVATGIIFEGHEDEIDAVLKLAGMRLELIDGFDGRHPVDVDPSLTVVIKIPPPPPQTRPVRFRQE